MLVKRGLAISGLVVVVVVIWGGGVVASEAVVKPSLPFLDETLDHMFHV